ncbi:putative transposase [Candidatus Nitrososphaera gargensis Ga9.2]|uniref:Putative transposase n=1 Tax=Nitrososphaera gargensis (strain Ga9.2) TaxID=1237085 RepID=K0IBY3_NITGG|nr:transposase [Candidatus Nitrososphaera gargensis]AFU57060.1 putative transposase [Candidatus Nitrososphaera gargensis Ga9.2]
MKKHVGIDVDVTKFAYDSDNHEVDNPLHPTKILKPLRRASRRLSRKQKGSKNKEKAKTRLDFRYYMKELETKG